MKKLVIKSFALSILFVALTLIICIGCTDNATATEKSNTVSEKLSADEEAVMNEEYQDQAAQEINEANVEAKLDALKKEIEGDL